MMRAVAVKVVACTATALLLLAVFALPAFAYTKTYGASVPSDYGFVFSLNSDPVEQSKLIACGVDHKYWIPYDAPFAAQTNYRYCSVFTYIPCTAGYPVSYNYPGFKIFESTSGSQEPLYVAACSVKTGPDLIGRSTLTVETRTFPSDNYPGGIATKSFTEGVDFEESCIFVGFFIMYQATSAQYGQQIRYGVVLDGVLTIFEGKQFPPSAIDNVTDYQRFYGFAGNSPIEAYTLGFSAIDITGFLGDGESDEINSHGAFIDGYSKLLKKYGDSDEYKAWLDLFFTSNGKDYSAELNEIKDSLSSINDALTADARVDPADPKLPSSSEKDLLSNIGDSDDFLFNSFADTFSQAFDLSYSFLKSVPDTEILLSLASVVNYSILRFLDLPDFGLIMLALITIFVLWICGLNFAAFRRDSSDRNSGKHN